jgi:hypothetical protein
MILRFSRQDLPANAMKAVLSIDKTLSAFRPEERLVIAAESILGVLRDLRLDGPREPNHQKDFDAICGDVQASLRREIEALRFEKSN